MKRVFLLLLLFAATGYGQTTTGIGNFPFNLQTKPSTDQIMVWDNADTNALGGTGGITYATIGTNLTYNHSTHTLSATGGGSTSPGGSNTQVQYNNSGAFGGSAAFTFDGTSKITLGTSSNTGTIDLKNTSGTTTIQPLATSGTSIINLPTGTGTLVFASSLPTFPTGAIVGTTDTQTLTNKRVSPRVLDVNVPGSSVTPDTDSYDGFGYRGLNGTLTLNVPTGTPTSQQRLLIRFKDDGTSRNLTFTTGANGFRASSDLPFPSATTAGKTMICGFIWNAIDSRWDMVAKLDNF